MNDDSIKLMSLLEELEDLITSSSKMPFSEKGIIDLDVVEGDESRHHRGILQRLGRVRCRHHDGLQLHRVADMILRTNTHSWHSQSHASQNRGLDANSHHFTCDFL